MTRNVGSLDRVLRLAAAAVLAVLAFNGVLDGWMATAAWIVAAVMAVTGLVGTCPAYRLIGMNTCNNR